MAAPTTVNLSEMSAQWRVARKLYLVYSALVRCFNLGELCPELETPINRSEPEIIARIQHWFDGVDQKIEVHQIRQLLQATSLSTEENIRLLLKRHLRMVSKSSAVRDKVDYLLVQYFAHCAPADAHNRSMSHEEVADVLHPIFGDVDQQDVPYKQEIETVLLQLGECKSLAGLLNGSILEKVRALKSGATDFFSPAALVSFTRLNYLIRLAFFRLMHADLHAIRHALHQIEGRSQNFVDCSAAGMSAQEPVSKIRQICHEWKKPFRAAYSAGNNFRQLVDIRASLEHALTQPFSPAQNAAVSPAIAPKAQAAVAVAVQADKSESSPASVPLGAGEPVKVQTKAAGATASPDLPPDVDSCLERLAMHLLAAKSGVTGNDVEFGNVKLMLASWELAAFLKGGDEVSDTLQRVVAARALLSLVLAAQASGKTVDVSATLQAAQAEIALLHSRVEDAKRANDIDAAMNLAASGKRLQALIAEAQKK